MPAQQQAVKVVLPSTEAEPAATDAEGLEGEVAEGAVAKGQAEVAEEPRPKVQLPEIPPPPTGAGFGVEAEPVSTVGGTMEGKAAEGQTEAAEGQAEVAEEACPKAPLPGPSPPPPTEAGRGAGWDADWEDVSLGEEDWLDAQGNSVPRTKLAALRMAVEQAAWPAITSLWNVVARVHVAAEAEGCWVAPAVARVREAVGAVVTGVVRFARDMGAWAYNTVRYHW